MPDDERLGGTRDPHEYGRRHRRDNPAPAPASDEQQPRRRRRSVESGGVSVADLVQRHTGSRPDLTPVNPDELRQNGVMTGRRARPDEPQSRPSPAPRSIASALDGGPGFPPDQAAPPRPAPQPAENFPRDEAANRRPGGTSSYFTIPSEAVRNSFSSDAAEPPQDKGLPVDFPMDFPEEDGPASRPRGIGEGSGPRPRRGRESSLADAFQQEPPGGYGPEGGAPRRKGGRRADFPGAESPRPGETSAHYPIPGEPPNGLGRGRRGGEAPNGFPEGPRRGGHRAGETSGFYGTDAPNGFPPDPEAPRHGGHRAGEASGLHGTDAPNGFPPDPDAPRRGGHRAGEASGHHGVPGADGFPADPDPSHRNGTRRAGEAPGLFGADAPNGFPPDPEAPRRGGRRAGEASAHHGIPGADVPNGFPPDPAPSRRNGARRTGEAPGLLGTDAPNGFPPDPQAPRRNGARRVGEASGLHGVPDGFPPDPEAPRRNGARRTGEGSGLHGVPDAANGFPPDPEASRRNGARRVGEASGLHGTPDAANGFPSEPDAPRRNGTRRTGEASGLHGVPGADAPNGFPADPEPSRRNGARRSGEASGLHGVPEAPNGFPPDPEAPRRGGGRRVGETSGRYGTEAPNGFPPDPEAPRRGGRRAGEASAHHAVPGTDVPNGFPPGDAAVPGADGFPPEGGAPRRKGGRRGEGFPQDGPRRRPVGENSGPFPGFPPDGDAPRPGPRRVGEASAHFGAPGFPPEADQSGPMDLPGRPEGAARRRAARAAAAPQQELGPRPGRFPADAPPPQPGQGSGLFPVDEFRRQPDELSDPRITPAAIDAPDSKPRRSTGVPPVPPPPPPMGDDDLISMTTEMEAIGNEEVQKRRSIDHTLARFSAVHDEIKAEEREKKAKRRKLRPWERDDEMDRLDELEAQQSMAMAIPNLDPPEEEDEKTAKRKRRWRKGKNAGKAFSIIIAGMIFVSTAVAWGFKSYIENSAQQVDALDPDSDAIKDAGAQLGDENFLLVGSDTRAGATAEDGVGSEDSVQGARSDTVMIAHIPKNRERVVVLSFPRDLEVTRPACEGWDSKTGNYTGQQHPEEKRVKLNTAYMVGGPKCVTKLVQNLSGLAINHFVGIDFHGFKGMVDAVDGVEVCVERPMKDKELGVVVPEAGKAVRLVGDQALNFVRARKVEGDPTADYGRIIRQQRFLSSLLRKAMSSEVLLNPGKLTNFVKAFSKSTFGDNIGVDQLFTLGQSMQGVEAGRVTFITVPTTGYENERHNEDLRVDDANDLFEAIRQDVPLPGEAPKQDDASKKDQQQQVQTGLKQEQPAGPVDPSTVKIQVLNGGNETGGIAGDTGDELAEFGFQVMRTGTTDPTDKTVIRYSKSRAAQAQTLKAAVPGATLVEDPSAGGAILLIIGPEFDGKVQSPTTGGPPVEVPENLSTVNAGDVSCA